MGNGRKYSDELNDEIRFIHKQYPKLSQAKIARRLDCSQTYVSRVLNNFAKNNNDKLESIPDLASLLVEVVLKLKTMPMTTQVANSIAKNSKLLYDIMKENQMLLGTVTKEQVSRIFEAMPSALRSNILDQYTQYYDKLKHKDGMYDYKEQGELSDDPNR